MIPACKIPHRSRGCKTTDLVLSLFLWSQKVNKTTHSSPSLDNTVPVGHHLRYFGCGRAGGVRNRALNTECNRAVKESGGFQLIDVRRLDEWGDRAPSPLYPGRQTLEHGTGDPSAWGPSARGSKTSVTPLGTDRSMDLVPKLRGRFGIRESRTGPESLWRA